MDDIDIWKLSSIPACLILILTVMYNNYELKPQLQNGVLYIYLLLGLC